MEVTLILYDYHCDSCSKTFEIVKPMSRSGDAEHCLSCGKKLRRIYTPAGVTWGKGCWEWDDVIDSGRFKGKCENGLGDHLIHNF